jgi:hypothetical protein
MGRTRKKKKKTRYAHRIFVGKPEEKRPLLRSRRMWDDNIKMDLRGIERADIYWNHTPQGRNQRRALVDMVMNIWGFIIFWKVLQ